MVFCSLSADLQYSPLVCLPTQAPRYKHKQQLWLLLGFFTSFLFGINEKYIEVHFQKIKSKVEFSAGVRSKSHKQLLHMKCGTLNKAPINIIMHAKHFIVKYF